MDDDVTVNQFDINFEPFLTECLSGNWIARLPATALWGSIAEFVGHVARKWVPKSAVRKVYLDGFRANLWVLKKQFEARMLTINGSAVFQNVSSVYVTSTFKRYETSLLLNMNFSFSCSRFRTWKLTRGNHWKPQAPWENRKSRCSDWKMSVQKWSRDPCHSAVTDKRVGLEVVELNCNKKLCEINVHLFKGPVDQGLPVVCHRTKQKNTWKAGCFSMFLCLALFAKAMIFRWHIKSVLDGHRLGRMAVSTSFETCWNHFHWTWMSIHTGIPFHTIPFHTIPYHSIPYHSIL